MTEHNFQKLEPSYIIGASILVGAILISAVSFYNTKILMEKSSANTTQGNNQVANAVQNPTKPVTVTGRTDAPVLGDKNAKVTMIEFSDFQCPYCKSYFDNTFAQIKKQYVDTGKVKIIFRHFPLSFHVNAEKSAEAAECANRQGKFWEYHNLLFTNSQSDGTNLDIASLKKYAVQIGLDISKFNSCLDNGETASVVKKDISDGQAAGTSGTPTFYIDGKQLLGAQPFSAFSSAIDAELK